MSRKPFTLAETEVESRLEDLRVQMQYEGIFFNENAFIEATRILKENCWEGIAPPANNAVAANEESRS